MMIKKILKDKEMSLDIQNIPSHIAIIMDGNGRWAQARGLSRSAGHLEGVETVKRITEVCGHLGVKYLTLYTFSTENWNRPADEVEALMNTFVNKLEDEVLMENDIRFRVIGDRDRLPESVQRRMDECMAKTYNNKTLTVTCALSYSSRWEITEMAKQIAKDAIEKKVRPEDINEAYISSHLQTNFMPDPDLLIRTGGELRISNYLLWQCAYSEFYFCDTFWPDFKEEDLHKAIESYQKRQRRFGKTEDQVENQQTGEKN